MNRGVVLGAILMIALIIYIVADTRSFNKAKPELKELADTFVSEFVSAGVTPEAYRTLDAASCSEECITAIKNNLQTVISEHMTPAESVMINTSMYGYYYGMNQEELLDISRENTPQYYGYVTKVTANPKNNTVQIKKSGVDLAQVLIEYEIEAEYAGNPYIHLLGLSTPVQQFSADETTQYSSDIIKAEGYISLELTMKKTEGTWRVAYVDWLGYNLIPQGGTASDNDTNLIMGGY